MSEDCAAGAELVLHRRHQLALLLAHRLAQVVGLGRAEAGDLLRDLHQLLLVDAAAVGRLGDRPQARVGVGDARRLALAARVVVDVAHRPRAVERDQGDDVVELRRAHLAQRVAHALGLELEDADRVAAGEHLVGLRVVHRDRLDVALVAARTADDLDRVLDHVEVAQAEEVHLQQPDLLDRVHRVLGDDLVLALGLAVRPLLGRRPAILGQLQRHDLVQGAVGDHHRRGVDRVVADDPLETLGDLDDPLHVGVGVDRPAQVLAGLQALLEARAAPHDRLRDQLRRPVAGGVVVAEHAGRVAGRRPRRHLAEGDDLGHRLAPVLLLHVADHALAPADREIDVDVGHRLARRVEEALEQEVVGERVEVGDVERVGDDRARRRAAPRADRDPVLLRVADEVPDDQEVGLEAHLVDHPELEIEPLDRLCRRRIAVATGQALAGEPVQHLARLLAVGSREARQEQLAELDLDVAALGDLERRRHRLGPGLERLLHLGRALEEELVGVEGQLRLLERRLGLHAEQRRVVLVVLASQVVDVGGGDQRPAELAGVADDALVGLRLLGDPVLLHLEVDIVGAEHLDQVVEMGAGVVGALFDQATAKARLQAAGERDHTVGVALEQLHVDVRLAAPEALEEAGRGELDQVAEAGVVGGHQGEVVALHPALGAAIVDQIGLEPEDRLDPVLATGLVVLDRAVHHPVVGEPERRHPEFGRPRGEPAIDLVGSLVDDLAGAVEQRVLAVHVQMDHVPAHRPIIATGSVGTDARNR